MPTVLRIRGYRVGFFATDWREPIHVHVSKRGCAAKFWMDPVALDANYGFRPDELREIFRILEHHENEIRQTWNEFFG
jgi:hypothetical protein